VCVCGAGFAIEIQLLVSFFAAAQKAQKKKERSETFSPTKKKRTSSYSAWHTSVCVSLVSGECHLAIHTWLQLQRHNFEQLSAGFRDGAYVHALWGWLTVSCVVRVFIAASVCVCVSLFLGQDFSWEVEAQKYKTLSAGRHQEAEKKSRDIPVMTSHTKLWPLVWQSHKSNLFVLQVPRGLHHRYSFSGKAASNEFIMPHQRPFNLHFVVWFKYFLDLRHINLLLKHFVKGS